MKVPTTFVSTAAAAAFAVLAACSSSSNGKGGGSVPSCQGATQSTGAGSAACNSCLESSCSSQISAVEGACSSYVTCYEGCQCSDLTCIEGCEADLMQGSCPSADQSLTTCLSQSCGTQCNGSSGDAG